MKIIRRSFGERFALLELEDGDYYHLPLESLHIPEVGEELKFYDFEDDHAVYYTTFRESDPPQIAGYYTKTDEPHHLKEL